MRKIRELAPSFLAGFFVALLGLAVFMMLADTVARVGVSNGG